MGYTFYTMEIPDYKIRALCTHLRRIVSHARYERTDTRTANAMRLAKLDLQMLEKYLNGKDDK